MKNNSNDNFNDDFLIKKAALSLIEKDNELLDLLEKDTSIVNPNQDELDKKIHSMIDEYLSKNNKHSSKKRKLKKLLLKIAVLVLILTSAFVIPFITVDAFRAKVLNYYIEIFETHLSFTPKKNDIQKTTNITVEYIPEGYDLRDETETLNYHSLTYYNYNSMLFNIKLYSDNTAFSIDSEECEEYTVNINNEIGYIYRKPGYVTLIFRHHNHSIVITSNDDTVTNEELVKIATNIKYK